MGRQALDEAAETIRAETAALKARVRQDLAAFTEELAAALPRQIDQVAAPDVQQLPGLVRRGHLEALAGGRGRDAGRRAGEPGRAGDPGGQRERRRGDPRRWPRSWAASGPSCQINVDTFKYDASVFALGALGTTVFLFVNTLAGGLLALAAPVAAMLLQGRVAAEIKHEAQAAGARGGPAHRRDAGAQAGRDRSTASPRGCRSSWPRRARRWPAGIAEVLAGALAERQTRARPGGPRGRRRGGRAAGGPPAGGRGAHRRHPAEGLAVRAAAAGRSGPAERESRRRPARAAAVVAAPAPGVGGGGGGLPDRVPVLRAGEQPERERAGVGHAGHRPPRHLRHRPGDRTSGATWATGRRRAGGATAARRPAPRCWACRCTSSTTGWPGR